MTKVLQGNLTLDKENERLADMPVSKGTLRRLFRDDKKKQIERYKGTMRFRLWVRTNAAELIDRYKDRPSFTYPAIPYHFCNRIHVSLA